MRQTVVDVEQGRSVATEWTRYRERYHFSATSASLGSALLPFAFGPPCA